MAFPITVGANPTTEEFPADQWSLGIQNINSCGLGKAFGSDQIVYYTYIASGGGAPSGLDITKWKIDECGVSFTDGTTKRDIYIYPVGENAKIELEA